MSKPVIRSVRPGDVDGVFALIRGLSIHEKELSRLTLTPEKLRGALFGKKKRVSCAVAEVNRRTVGVALWFSAFSSLRGGWLIFLEGLFVRARYRGRGIGRALLTHVAKCAVREHCLGVIWVTRVSNKKAIAFYKSFSAVQHLDNCHFVLVGEALNELAEENS